MRSSHLFPTTQRSTPAGEPSRNAQLLEQAGYVNKLFAGVYTYLPLGWRVIERIADIIRDEMNAAGGQELFMPALQPEELYEQSGRADIDVLFHLELANKTPLVLGLSHEEVIVPLVKKYVQSYKDLPLYLYQIQTKFRNELRAKSGILRGREFIMKDLYSFHRDEADLQKYYDRMKQVYRNIFDRCGIGDQTHLTYASGGSFSKFSHEFQTITPAGEDTIHVCTQCGTAVNEEVINDYPECPECSNKAQKKEKAIEVGNIFPLKDRFSSKFSLTYTDEHGASHPVIMGCYGIGLGRLMGTIVELHNDERGIRWPMSVAPYQVHLTSIGNTDAVAKRADVVYQSLQKKGIDTLYDDRDERAGVKLADADLIGIPHRLVVSQKTGERVEYTDRQTGKPILLSLPAAIKQMSR